MRNFKSMSLSVAVFGFLLSGQVLYNYFFTQKGVLLSYFWVSTAVLFTVAMLGLASRRKNFVASARKLPKITGLLLIAPIGISLWAMARVFGYFGEIYGQPYVAFFGIVAVAFGTAYASYKGKVGVLGFIRMTLPVILALLFATLFGFFGIPRGVYNQPRGAVFVETDHVDAVLTALLVITDVLVVSGCFTDEKEKDSPSLFYDLAKGVVLFVVVSGVLVTNCLAVFEESIALGVFNPYLCVTRLIPIPELPGIALFVMVFFAIIRVSIYLLCFVKNVRHAEKSNNVSKALMAVIVSAGAIVGTAMLFFEPDGRGIKGILSVSVTLWVIFFYIFKRKTRGDGM